MLVELREHDGWHAYFAEAPTKEEAAYKAIREQHEFLTDSNHSYEAGEQTVTWGGQERQFKSVRIYRAHDAPRYSGPPALETDYWFAVEYR